MRTAAEYDCVSPVGTSPPQMCAVATAWEAAAAGVRCRRQAILRTSVVLDRNSPAPHRLTTITRFGLGARIGDGRQWVSWLHIDDFLAITRLDRPSCDGSQTPSDRVLAVHEHLGEALRELIAIG
ncbi:MAG TPA: hypothetical protein VFG00_03645 [Acidothermaceae bacterium]|nr:hypothetical protein [Acidothermaceae bacterium]